MPLPNPMSCRNNHVAHRACTGPLYGCHTVTSTGTLIHFSEEGQVGFSVTDYSSVSLLRGFILWERKPRKYQTYSCPVCVHTLCCPLSGSIIAGTGLLLSRKNGLYNRINALSLFYCVLKVQCFTVRYGRALPHPTACSFPHKHANWVS